MSFLPCLALGAIFVISAGATCCADTPATNAPVVNAPATNAAANAPPPFKPTRPLGSLKVRVPKIVYHFETSVFYLPQFPGHASFQQDSLTRENLGPWHIETTFYNASFEEVKRGADKLIGA